MYALINNDNELDLFAEEDDNCYLCSNMSVCPLLGALKDEVVILRYEAMSIAGCSLFKEEKKKDEA